MEDFTEEEEIQRKKELEDLESVFLFINGQEEIEAASSRNYTELKYITIDIKPGEDISTLSKWKSVAKVEDLTLAENSISNIDFLSNLPFLQLLTLNLIKNKITNLDIFEKIPFKNLKFLELFSNEISNIEGLAKGPLENLNSLNLENNLITNIDSFEKAPFKNLDSLNLRQNKIENINIFEKVPFKNLKSLYLAKNKIRDIKVLAKNPFPQIELIYLEENKIEKKDLVPYYVYYDIYLKKIKPNEKNYNINFLNPTNPPGEKKQISLEILTTKKVEHVNSSIEIGKLSPDKYEKFFDKGESFDKNIISVFSINFKVKEKKSVEKIKELVDIFNYWKPVLSFKQRNPELSSINLRINDDTKVFIDVIDLDIKPLELYFGINSIPNNFYNLLFSFQSEMNIDDIYKLTVNEVISKWSNFILKFKGESNNIKHLINCLISILTKNQWKRLKAMINLK